MSLLSPPMAEFMFEEFFYLRFSGSFCLYLLGVNGVNEEVIVRPQADLRRGWLAVSLSITFFQKIQHEHQRYILL